MGTEEEPLREVIARNLRALRDAGINGLGSIKAISQRSGVSNGAVGRMVKPESQEWVDQFEKVTAALGVEPWHVMLPELDPMNLPPRALSSGLTVDRYSLLALELAAAFDARCTDLKLSNGKQKAQLLERVKAALAMLDGTVTTTPATDPRRSGLVAALVGETPATEPTVKGRSPGITPAAPVDPVQQKLGKKTPTSKARTNP